MALPEHHHHLQLSYEPQQSKDLRNLYEIEGQISQQPFPYFSTSSALPDPHPLYAPPFHVVGFAPGPSPGAEIDLGWSYGGLGTCAAEEESKHKRAKKEPDLFLFKTNNNNSQISSLDFLQPRSVSTGLDLSLDNTNYHPASSCPSSSSVDNNSNLLVSLFGDEFQLELQRQDNEIDRYLKIQGDRLRQAVVEKVRSSQIQTLSLVEEKILQKLRAKETEVEIITRKNMELEERMEQLSVEADAWQQRARHNENMMSALKHNLQQVYAQSKDSKEGCGDSEVDDTASFCNDRGIDFHLLGKEKSNDRKDLSICKVCQVKEVCMLILPCKHLCLCKDCESKLSICPLCHASKLMGLEVYM